MNAAEMNRREFGASLAGIVVAFSMAPARRSPPRPDAECPQCSRPTAGWMHGCASIPSAP